MTDEGTTDLPSVGHTLNAVVIGLDHLIKSVDDRGLEQLDDPALIGFMQTFERLRNRLSLVDHQIIADGQRGDLPKAMCQGTMRRVLTSALSLSKSEAARRVRAAEAVGPRTSMLGEALEPIRPRLAAAQRDGEVSLEKVAIIARALGRVDRCGFDPADLDTGEKLLVDQAPVLPPEDLRVRRPGRRGRRPDGTLSNDQLNQDRRHVEFHQCQDGSWAGTLRLSGSLGTKLQAVNGPLAKPRVNTLVGRDGRLVEEPDPRYHGQRVHDALEDVCDRMLRTDTGVPDAGGTPATVIITIDIEDLLNGTGYGITSDGILIRTDQVHPLIDQAEAYYAFLDRNGVVLNLGRTRRIATRGHSAALYARDAGCSFPGCDRAPGYCERHHIIPWLDGDETNLNNLTLLCVYHHHNFLGRGWTCRMNTDGIPEWIPPGWVDRDPKPLVNTRIHATLIARRQARLNKRVTC